MEQQVQEIKDTIPIQLNQVSPLYTAKKFSELTGVSEGVVTGWINRGYVPTKIVGKRRLINNVQLMIELAEI